MFYNLNSLSPLDLPVLPSGKSGLAAGTLSRMPYFPAAVSIRENAFNGAGHLIVRDYGVSFPVPTAKSLADQILAIPADIVFDDSVIVDTFPLWFTYDLSQRGVEQAQGSDPGVDLMVLTHRIFPAGNNTRTHYFGFASNVARIDTQARERQRDILQTEVNRCVQLVR